MSKRHIDEISDYEEPEEDAVEKLWARKKRAPSSQLSRPSASLGSTNMESLEGRVEKAKQSDNRTHGSEKPFLAKNPMPGGGVFFKNDPRNDNPDVVWTPSMPGVPDEDRQSIRDHIAWLDEKSLVKQFTEGTYPDSKRHEDPDSASGICATRVLVWKTWHADPKNKHFTARLEQVQSDGTTISYGAAHVYEDKSETLHIGNKEFRKTHGGGWETQIGEPSELRREQRPTYKDPDKPHEESHGALEY